MSKPETTFYTSVHRHLPSIDDLYRVKMSNDYVAGIPDVWYSGKKADLWVEWKFIKVPVRDDTVIDLCGGKKPPLSALQQDWLRCRYEEGRNVCVIVGCEAGGVVMISPFEWETPIQAVQFRRALWSRKEIAAWIQRKVS